jgi:tRNA G18 (ribose-2'-O)-methylase SpoU
MDSLRIANNLPAYNRIIKCKYTKLPQKKTMDELGRLSPDELKEAEKHPIIVILDDVRSMHNVGSVFRTCDAFAAESLYLCGYTPAPPHRDIHKTVLGATETVAWKSFATTLDAVNHARENGYKIYAVEQVHNSIMLHNPIWKQGKIALVFGNEVTGVNEEVIKAADGCIEIPQWVPSTRLIYPVSVGIVLWDAVKPE